MFGTKKKAPTIDEDVTQMRLNLNALEIKTTAARAKVFQAKREKAPPARLATHYRAYSALEKQTAAISNALMLIESAEGVAAVTNAQQTATRVIQSVTQGIDHDAINDAHHETAEMLSDATASLSMAIPFPDEPHDIEAEISALLEEDDERTKEPSKPAPSAAVLPGSTLPAPPKTAPVPGEKSLALGLKRSVVKTKI